MHPAPAKIRCAGFTLVELLLALVLGALVAAILALLAHGLLFAGEAQSRRLQGPFAARAALRAMSRELACAFPPPVADLVPLQLATSTEPGQPDVWLSFYAPVPAEPRSARFYDVEQVSYAVRADGQGVRELLRVSAPCSGPRTNAPATNLLLRGRFTLAVEALAGGVALPEWPPPISGDDKPGLPTSVRLSLAFPGEDPIRTETLVQAASGIRSPIEREPAGPNESGPPPPPPHPPL
ncbi:MAG: prepilin-type N-terminal cleavage/methylation domain-containing protein [Kiritimatiellia bacterium]